jgi:AcrR family transcriptional regulator
MIPNEVVSTLSSSKVKNKSVGQDSVATPDKILDAAETLFIEKGFAATSLRSIASLAGVNLAATHYHFGSKEGLFAATIHRRMLPVNQIRLEALEALQSRGEPLSVELIIGAFFMPFTRGEVLPTLPRLMGRVYGEPVSLTQPLLQEEFSEVAGRFIAALGEVLTETSEEELRWRFHFMIGAMIQFFSFDHPIGLETDDSRQPGFERLQAFVIAGFLQELSKEQLA